MGVGRRCPVERCQRAGRLIWWSAGSRRKIRGDNLAASVQQFTCVPTVSTAKFEHKSMRGFLLEQRKPFIQPGIVFHQAKYMLNSDFKENAFNLLIRKKCGIISYQNTISVLETPHEI